MKFLIPVSLPSGTILARQIDVLEDLVLLNWSAGH